MELQYGNQLIAKTSYNNKVIPIWEKCYALHRKHNHDVMIVIYFEPKKSVLNDKG